MVGREVMEGNMIVVIVLIWDAKTHLGADDRHAKIWD